MGDGVGQQGEEHYAHGEGGLQVDYTGVDNVTDHGHISIRSPESRLPDPPPMGMEDELALAPHAQNRNDWHVLYKRERK